MIVFNEPQKFELSYLEDGFRARLLETEAFGVSPTEAISNLVERIEIEARAILKAFTHLLSPEERRRKGILLSAVDIIESGIEPQRDSVWVFGEVRDRIFTSAGDSYNVHVAILARDGLYFALMETTKGGIPGDVILKLEEVKYESSDYTAVPGS